MTKTPPTIDPDMMAAILKHKELQEADGGVPASLAENRAQQDRLAPYWAEGAPELAQVADLSLDGHRGPLAARLYRPDAGATTPVILFLHGGGWARGTIPTGEWACRALAAETGLTVLSLGYSLAPEHPFPAAIEDIRAAMDWCAAHGARHGIDGSRIFLAGTSAGGNLSLVAALARRDAGEAMPAGLGLFYGVFGDDLSTDSYAAYGPGQYGLSLARVKQYFEWYVPAGHSSRNPLISPLNADLTDMPPTWLGIAEFDVLRDDSFELARRLEAAHIPVEVRHFEDMAHGFAMYARTVPKARLALSDAAKFFREIALRPA